MKYHRHVVCLCGSTRFKDLFDQVNMKETLAGNIVLSIGCVTSTDNALNLTENQKRDLDYLHIDKIRMAGTVIFLNKGGYIGESTQRELACAIAEGKVIEFFEPKLGEEYLESHSHPIAFLVRDYVTRTAFFEGYKTHVEGG